MGKDDDETVTVYIVDDDEHVLAALVAYVGRAPGLRVVGSARNASTARSEITALHPHVAVLDARIGDEDGLELCKALRVAAPDTACVMLTAGASVGWDAGEARDAGAVATLFKQLVDFPLVEAILDAAPSRVGDDRRDTPPRTRRSHGAHLVPPVPPQLGGDPDEV